jgi:hypothetical protein
LVANEIDEQRSSRRDGTLVKFVLVFYQHVVPNGTNTQIFLSLQQSIQDHNDGRKHRTIGPITRNLKNRNARSIKPFKIIQWFMIISLLKQMIKLIFRFLNHLKILAVDNLDPGQNHRKSLTRKKQKRTGY